MTTRALAVAAASMAFVAACGGSGKLDTGAPENLLLDDVDIGAATNRDGQEEVAPPLATGSDANTEIDTGVDGNTSDDAITPGHASADNGFSLKFDGLGDPIELGDGVALDANPERIEPGFEDLSHRYEGIDTFGDDPAIDALWSQCEGGDFARCDQLFVVSPIGSGYETFGDTCGGRQNSAAGTCAAPQGGAEPLGGAFGDHPGLDALWTACATGVYDPCDDLWGMSPISSVYEAYGSTCGDATTPTNGGCVEHFGTGSGDDLFANTYGDDPGLDAVYDACTSVGAAACDLLFDMSPLDSDYEQYAATCGGRRQLTFTSCI